MIGFRKRVAYETPSGAFGVDLVIPVLVGKEVGDDADTNFEPREFDMSCIVIQVKNWRTASLTATRITQTVAKLRDTKIYEVPRSLASYVFLAPLELPSMSCVD